jgi:glycosyltransferase involved in cell wall biosynthesis
MMSTDASPLRIAQVAPLFERVPPPLYGGSERVVSYLTEALVRQGHDVTLFASGDSETSARLVAGSPQALWRDARVRETLPHHVHLMELVFREIEQFDVVHFHTDYLHFPLVRRHGCASVTTLHGMVHPPDVGPLFREFSDVPLVSISNNQRTPLPDANWAATVYHGLPRDAFTFQPAPGTYLAYIGRMSPEKRVDRAIEIATRVGMPLKIAAKIYPEERDYYHETLAPLIAASPLVEYLGEIDHRHKNTFLGQASALLFPIEWPEPFGLVMIEAMACGTPVIAWRRGSVPEVVDDSVTGFIVESIDAGAAAVHEVGRLSRAACRRHFERRFDAARMAADYVEVYRRVISAHQLPGVRPSRGVTVATPGQANR